MRSVQLTIGISNLIHLTFAAALCGLPFVPWIGACFFYCKNRYDMNLNMTVKIPDDGRSDNIFYRVKEFYTLSVYVLYLKNLKWLDQTYLICG